MLCTRCHKNEATVYYKQNINGEVREYALCRNCADEMTPEFEPINIFGSLFSVPKAVQPQRKRCTLCGSTFEEIRHRGKVGCSECYTVFSEELKPIIQNIHGKVKHVEKESEENTDEITALRKELKNAIENEEYEKAAELRDRIKAKEAENNEA